MPQRQNEMVVRLVSVKSPGSVLGRSAIFWTRHSMDTATGFKPAGLEPKGFGGWLLLVLLGLAALVAATAVEMRDPLKMMLEWELLAVFVRPETHGWYRTVIAMVGMDAAIGAFIVAGAGWLLMLAWRRSARFPVHIQAWLLAIVVMRTIAFLLGDHMTHAIAIDISVPFDGFIEAVVAAALAIPYFRRSRRVRNTFLSR
jgi:hypothetical protein